MGGTPQEVKQAIKEVVRLDPVQYSTLERQLPGPVIGKDTTELQVAYNLGVQAVLKLLREGYVSARL